MDLRDILAGRRSVRDYLGQREITDAQLRQVFEAVRLSPSSYNLQPWEFVVVRSPERKKLLRACANDQAHVEEASAVVIVLGSLDPLLHAEDILSDRVIKGYYDEARKEKVMAILKARAADREYCRVWAVRSVSLAAMTLMLAAKGMGIDSCPIEGFEAAKVRAEFGIPDGYEVVMIVTLGFSSSPERPRLKRYGFDEIVHFEKFNH